MKKIIWIGSSYDDLKEFPTLVRNAVGYALFFAQEGKKHPRKDFIWDGKCGDC